MAIATIKKSFDLTKVGGTAIALGQAAMAASFPVVIASNQSAIPVSQSGTWNIGTVATITNAVTVAQATASSLNATVVGTGTFAVQAAQSGTWNINNISGTIASHAVTNAGTFAVQAAQSGTWTVTATGNVASGASDSGNPVKIGAVYNSTLPTVTNGQRVDLQATARGAQILALYDTQATPAALDASTGGQIALKTFIYGSIILPVQSNVADGSALGSTNTDSLPIAGSLAGTKKTIEVKTAEYRDSTTQAMAVRVAGNVYGVNALNSTTPGNNAVLVAQLDDTSPTAITENSFGNVRMSTLRSLHVARIPESSATVAPTTYKDFGSVTKANVKGSAGNVFSIRVTNENAAARYFQLHNKATAPAAADTAQRSWKVPAGTSASPGILQLDIHYFAFAVAFATGIGWAISTTDSTFTDSATASEHDVEIQYI